MATVRLVCFLLALSLAAPAQTARSVDDLVGFIKSAIQTRQDDKRVAEQVQRITLSNRLEDRTVQELQHLGAGPKTVTALQKLSAASANLPAAAPAPKSTAAVIPPPDPAELKSILAQVQENALNYSRNLPNYICTQVTKRHVDPTGTESWRLADTILEHLTFFEQQENYTVVMVNNNVVTNNLKHDQLGGASSSGEFGSLLHTVFEPATQTEFTWDRWTTLGGRRTYVFAFRVGQQRYSIRHDPSKRTILTSYHGLVFVDRDRKSVMKLQMECDDIPADFPIQSVKLVLYYDVVEISGQEFVLPLHSEVHSREGRYLSWNETSYLAYRKYAADATISFGAPEDIPPEKLKEKPDQPPAQPPKKKQ